MSANQARYKPPAQVPIASVGDYKFPNQIGLVFELIQPLQKWRGFLVYNVSI